MSDYLSNLPDLADLVRVLSFSGVRYLVVGGHAVGFHGKPRATKDLDLWIDPGDTNRKRLATALSTYGAPDTVIENVRRAKRDEIVWFGRSPNRVDFLLELPGVDFDVSYERAVFAPSGDQQIPVIGVDDLIRNKESVGRDQDRVDVKVLRAAKALSASHSPQSKPGI